MSEPVPHRADDSPGQAASPLSEADPRAETLPLNSATKEAGADAAATVGPGGRAAPDAVRAVDATKIDASVAEAAFVPTIAAVTGVDQTLEFVSQQVQRKAAAVLRTHVG